MRRKISIIVVVNLMVAVGVFAQEGGGEGPRPVTPKTVRQGSLLFHAGGAVAFVEAPLQATDVEISVRGIVADTVVAQSFSNPTEQWMEGVYVFPLPTGAAVYSMRLVIGERIIEGRIEEREAAKKAYVAAKRQGRKASLVEQERPNIFTTSVANIGPGETVEVRIEYQQTLKFDHGELELRFPMVVGPRFMPGMSTGTTSQGTGWAFDTDQVPDASRISPPVALDPDENLNPVTLRVTLEAGFPLSRLVSPYHPVQIARPDGRRHVIVLDGPVPADRDFVLRWAPEAGRTPKAAVFTEEWDGEFFVMAMVVPPADEFAEAVRLPRETVFVIDTSGSMGGASIVQAREALLFALNQLAPEDFFNIIEFDSNFTVLFPESQPAMPAAIQRATAWVERLRADGGTEMMAPLLRALEDHREVTPLRQVIFITDGCVGNEEALFSAVERHLGRSRLFTVGIGSAPNGFFMERAAVFGRGTFTFIGAPSEVDSKMRGLFVKLENPVLASIEMSWPDPGAEVWPRQIPDLYAGDPVVVAARLGTIEGDLRLSGVRADAQWASEIPLRIGSERAGIHRLWARRKIAALMDDAVRGIKKETVREEVLNVALKHQLISKYTCLVAVDVTPTRPAGENMKTAAVPTNLPAGWRAEKVFGVMPAGGTAGRLHLLVAMLLLMSGVALWKMKGGSR
jgi:Ca-activated chloride channel family protein